VQVTAARGKAAALPRKKPRDVADKFQNPAANLASLSAAPNLKFERQDWTSFRTVEGLMQKAGVPKHKLARLVMKELADNALDTNTKVTIGERRGGGYFVDDEGPGIDGTPEDIARLFSINRPMISSKLIRLPQRGALGNGLRVVAGAVLASEGILIITTRDKRIELRPEHDGSSTVVSIKTVKFPIGTRVEIVFGPALPCDERTLGWARRASRFDVGMTYTGKTSPFWYDVPHFHELLSASGDTLLVRELIAELDGCSGGKAGEIANAANLQRTLCKDVTREQAADLLEMAPSCQSSSAGAAGCRRRRIIPRLCLCTGVWHCDFRCREARSENSVCGRSLGQGIQGQGIQGQRSRDRFGRVCEAHTSDRQYQGCPR
jgi:hypothetical protein